MNLHTKEELASHAVSGFHNDNHTLYLYPQASMRERYWSCSDFWQGGRGASTEDIESQSS